MRALECIRMRIGGLASVVVLVAVAALAAPPLEVRAQTAILQGIDVSSWQGPSIDWPAVAGSGISFTYIRAGDGTYADPDFLTNWRRAQAAGITPGAYLFYEPSQDPIAQANLLIQQLQSVAMRGGDLVPVIDVETTGNEPASTIVARLQITVQMLRSSTGALPTIYTAPSWWDGNVGSSAFTADPLWVANWFVSNPSVPAQDWGGNGWRVWQYSDNGSVPGVPGRVDLDQSGANPLPLYGLEAGNLLRQASLQPGLDGSWQFDAGDNMTVSTHAGGSLDGQSYLEVQSGVAGGTVHQDVADAVSPGHDDTLSIWVRSAPGGQSASGTLALWGLGLTATEGSNTSFTTSPTWTLVTTTLDPLRAHSTLRAQVYLGSAGVSVDLDGTRLTPQLLDNASFDSGGPSPWQWDQNAQMNVVVASSGGAKEGPSYLQASTAINGGSVWQDVSAPIATNADQTFSVWVRSPSGQASGTLALWGIGINGIEGAETPFVAGAGWTEVVTTLDPQQTHNVLRAQIYLDTPGTDLDLDGAELVQQLLRNASLDTPGPSVWQSDPSNQVNMTVGQGGAVDGPRYLDASDAHAGGSVYQDVSAAISPNIDDTFSIWVRSPGGAPATGSVALWAIGTNGTEGSSTPFVASSSWTQIFTTLDPIETHSALRAQMYLNTTGVQLQFDGGVLTTNLLRQASFEPSAGDWQFDTGFDMTVTPQSGVVVDGHSFVEVRTGVAGGAVHQDVTAAVAPGRDDTVSVWVRAPPGGQPATGMLALWGLGINPTEGIGTPFTTGPNWTLIAATLDPQHVHSMLRAQVYVTDAGASVDLDGAKLSPQLLDNASFDTGGTSSWNWDQTTQMNGVVYSGGAVDGHNYLEANTGMSGGSVWQDVVTPVPTTQDDTLSVWIRSRDGQPASGALAVWGLGINPTEGTVTGFVAGPAWTLVTATLDPKQTHSTLRAQIFLDTTGVNFDFDGADLAPQLLRNASFESASASWQLTGGPATTAAAESGSARDGQQYLKVSTTASGGSLYQDAALVVTPYRDYTFGVWVRSDSGQSVAGTLTLSALSVNGTEATQTPFIAGAGWTLVTVTLDPQLAHSTLEAAIDLACHRRCARPRRSGTLHIDPGRRVAAVNGPRASGSTARSACSFTLPTKWSRRADPAPAHRAALQ